MVLLSEGSSIKESPEDKQACAPCVRGSAKISRRVTLALYTRGPGFNPHWGQFLTKLFALPCVKICQII